MLLDGEYRSRTSNPINAPHHPNFLRFNGLEHFGMEIIEIDTKDNRIRFHVRARNSDDDELVVYGLRRHLNNLPSDAEPRIHRILSNHNIKRYPEGSYIGVFASYDLTSSQIREPAEVLSDPYPHNIDLTEFPPDQGQLYKW